MGNSSKQTCPECHADMDDPDPTSLMLSCKKCGSHWVRNPKSLTGLSPGPKVIQKVLKCPHCDGLLILKIPVVFEIKENEITKKKAVTCPACKGEKSVEGVECDKCKGLGAMPASPPKPKDDKKKA